MHVTYDTDVGAAYIYLGAPRGPKSVGRTVVATAEINLDFDHDGHLIGLEILNVAMLPPELAATAEIIGPKRET